MWPAHGEEQNLASKQRPLAKIETYFLQHKINNNELFYK